MDETGLFYRLIPDKTICNRAKQGHKNYKDRVSIALCSNMSGTKRTINPSKLANPRCSKKFYVVCHHS